MPAHQRIVYLFIVEVISQYAQENLHPPGARLRRHVVEKILHAVGYGWHGYFRPNRQIRRKLRITCCKSQFRVQLESRLQLLR